MPQQPFLALITPLSDARIDNTLPGGQPGVPSHPIYLPPGINYPTFPTHPIVVPPGGAWPPPGTPSHPIYNPVYPDQGLPGGQPYPDQGLPGGQPYPDQGLPGSQPRPDQGLPPFPSHPWVPPQYPIIDPGDPQKAYLVAYMPKSGGGYERITFSVEIPEREPPTTAEPKPGGEGLVNPSR